MDLSDILRAVTSLQPLISQLIKDAEKGNATGDKKKEQVLELVGSVYEGAQRLRILDGVKELKGVPWVDFLPLISLFIDGIVKLYNTLGIFLSRKLSKPT